MQKDQQIIQSYSITEFPRNIGIYGERIILRLAEIAYDAVRTSNPDFDFSSGETPMIDLSKVKLKKGCSIYPISTPTKKYYEITIPAHDIMPQGDTKHYSVLKEHLKSLMNVILEKNGENESTFEYYHLINDIESETGRIRMNIRAEVWHALLNFTKGYRYYNISKALTLNSSYSLRLYMLVAGQKTQIPFSIEKLKNMFALEKKYGNNKDFIRNVINKSKDELDQKMPYSFTYELQHQETHKRGKPAISGITLNPVHIPKNDTDNAIANSLKHRITMFGFDRETGDILFEYFAFTVEEIQNNLDLFEKARKMNLLPSALTEMKPNANRAVNPKGYIIQTLKNLTTIQDTIL